MHNVNFIRQDNLNAYESGGISQEEYQEQDDALKEAEDLFQGQDMARLAKLYLQESVPAKIKTHELFKDFWAVHGNTLKLTFLTEDDVDLFELRFRKCVALWKMSKATYEFTFDDMQLIEQLRFYMVATLKRSVGRDRHIINERTMQSTHISQNIRSNTEKQTSGGSGFMGKMRSLF